VLVELGLLEQRHKAVLELLNGATVTDVARRYRVARQTLHDWLRRYARNGMAALSDRSSKPATCPHQMPPRTLRVSVLDLPPLLSLTGLAAGVSCPDLSALKPVVDRLRGLLLAVIAGVERFGPTR
jgi:hypothetical protein